MPDDKITRVIRETSPDPGQSPVVEDEALRQARWDRRLEAARARRAQVLAEKRARGEEQGRTLLSRKPWDEEVPPASAPASTPAAAPPPPPAPKPALRLVGAQPAGTPPDSVEDAADPAPIGGVEAAVAAETKARHERRAPPPVFEPLAPEETGPAPARRRRRIGPLMLAGGFAVGGLAALGLLLAPTPPATVEAPAPATLVEDTAAVRAPATDAPVAADATGVTALPAPAPDDAPDAPDAPETAVAAAPASTPVAEETAAVVAPEVGPEAGPEVVPEGAADSVAEAAFVAPEDIDLAALDAIALAAPPAADAAVAELPGAGDATGPRSLAPPPLVAPADPALTGIGVRAQVAAPVLPAAATRTAEASDVATPEAGRAVVAAAAPALALPRPETPAAIAATPPAPFAVVARVGDAAVLPAAPADGAALDALLPVAMAAVARPEAAGGLPAPEAGPAPLVDAAPPAPLPAAPVAEAPETVVAEPEVAVAEPEPEVAVAEPAPEALPPPRAEAVLVHILAPRDTPADRVAETVGTVDGLGYTSRAPAEVGVTIRQTQVRYYHPEDAAAADLVAAAVGGPARDFTDFRPQPPAGTVEVWLEGELAPEPEPVRAPVAVRAAPAPVPAPPPPPQPVGYCWRGEPGTPGAIRVPIVDGRCAWP